MDADRRSIISRIESLKKTYENPSFSDPPWGTGNYGPGLLLFDWWISLNILFRLFGDVRFTRSDLKYYSYPPLPLRRHICEVAAFSTIKDIWDTSVGAVAREVLDAGRNEIENAFALMLGEEPSINGLQLAFSKTGVKHGLKLEEYWNSKLVERLRPFSYEF
jgi:hypothetical protein